MLAGSVVVDLRTDDDAAPGIDVEPGGDFRGTRLRRSRRPRREAASAFAHAADVWRALLDDRLELHFQPILSLAAGGVVGAEALLRARPPGPGRRAGAVGEVANRMQALAPWTIERGCAAAAAWATAGVVTYLNLSPLQLSAPDIVGVIGGSIDLAGIEPGDLVVEVTESIPVSAVTVANLSQLRGMGVGIALDDFGTGYADLVALRELPIDTVKFDRRVIQALSPSGELTELVAAAIDVAHLRGLKTVAEGVETSQQFHLAVSCGFDLAQGFLLGRPQPAASLQTTLEWAGRRLAASWLTTPAAVRGAP